MFRPAVVIATFTLSCFGGSPLRGQRVVEVSTDGTRFVPMPGGSFLMGDRRGEGTENELPVHRVSVSDFLLAETEITVAQFRRFVQATGYVTSAQAPRNRAALDSLLLLARNPELTREERAALNEKGLLFGGCPWWNPDHRRFEFSEELDWTNPGFPQDDEHPAVCLSWDDAASYANWLSGLEGLPPAYDVLTGDLLDAAGRVTSEVTGVRGYRLPTEAEWEYAAREGGGEARFGNGEDVADPEEAAFDASSTEHEYQRLGPLRRQTSPVRSFPPNALGLFDMAGNAWEWVSDFLSPYPEGPVFNPYQTHGQGRAVRGGRWGGDAFEMRATKRFQWQSNNRCNASGFRLARSE